MVLKASFLVIKAHAPRGYPHPAGSGKDHAGTGGARSRAIRAGFRPNIPPDTATSTIGNVT